MIKRTGRAGGQRGLVLSVVFLVSAFFFWTLINQVPRAPRAADVPVSVFFEETDLSVPANERIPVNVIFATAGDGKISGGTVTLDYSVSKDVITYDESASEGVDVQCQNGGHALSTLAHVNNDPIAGKVSLSRVLVDSQNENLPSGTFCFTTFYFTVNKTVNTYPAEADIALDTNTNACEIVGPDKTYSCDFFSSTNNIVSIIIQQPGLVSPTPEVTTTPIKTTTSLHFEPVTQTVAAGETVDVRVVLDTGENSIATVDALFDFDEDLLAFDQVLTGQFLPLANDNVASAGAIYLAGIADTPQGVKGKGTFVILRFMAKAAGVQTLHFACTQGVTDDSNATGVGSTATDLLNCADSTDGTIIITDAQISTTPSATGSASVTPSLSCPNKEQGNCTCDEQGTVDLTDFNCWRTQFFGVCSSADFNGDGLCDLPDFNIWRVGYFAQTGGGGSGVQPARVQQMGGSVRYEGALQTLMPIEGAHYIFIPGSQSASQSARAGIDLTKDVTLWPRTDLQPSMHESNVNVTGLFIPDYYEHLRASDSPISSDMPEGQVILLDNIVIVQ